MKGLRLALFAVGNAVVLCSVLDWIQRGRNLTWSTVGTASLKQGVRHRPHRYEKRLPRPTPRHALPPPIQAPPPLRDTIKITFPVLVASLYRSGTTSLHRYFRCGNVPSAHFSHGRQRLAPILQRNIQQNRSDIFHNCGNYSVYSDLAYLNAPHGCFDPSVYGLEAFYKSHPNGTLVLSTRSPTQWLDSVQRFRFRNWDLYSTLQRCPDLWPKQPRHRANLTRHDLLDFYQWHQENVRQFAINHPSLTFIEVHLEDSNAGAILEDNIGISRRCWKQHNKNLAHPGNLSWTIVRPGL